MKTPLPLPSTDELRRLFDLDEQTGQLIRRIRNDVPARINKRFSGKVAGYTDSRGYIQVGIGRTLFLAHRIVWKMVHGDEPAELDHINNDPSDNRPCNLRRADRSENVANRRKRRKKVLPKGVFATPSGNYYASIRMRGVTTRLGTFSTVERAQAAYGKAAAEIHGEFART